MISGQKLLKAKSSMQTAHFYTIILIISGGKAVIHYFFPYFLGSVAVTVLQGEFWISLQTSFPL